MKFYAPPEASLELSLSTADLYAAAIVVPIALTILFGLRRELAIFATLLGAGAAAFFIGQ